MEFGSDFHRIDGVPYGKSYFEILGKEFLLYANGRQALEIILSLQKINRIWFPSYYCHESIENIKKKSYQLLFYPCTPTDDVETILKDLDFSSDDAIVVMNFFGIKSKPIYRNHNCTIIEDHSHDLTSEWALKSEANWCFASLRKTLPIPDGGILWSPKGQNLPKSPESSTYVEDLSIYRYGAMSLKTNYLFGHTVDKDEYLKAFQFSEEWLGKSPISEISSISKNIISGLSISKWYDEKKRNWNLLSQLIIPSDKFRILRPEKDDGTPFSLTLLFSNINVCNTVRKALIKNNVYPAVLWRIPSEFYGESVEFGNRVLSIHCDGRYSEEDIVVLGDIINKVIKND